MPSQRQLDRLFASFCRSGDPRALGRVFDATAAELLHLAIWLSGNRADGEDLLQRTFVRAIELREQFEIGRPVMPWLVGLLGNLAKHLQRDRQQRPLPRPGAAVPDPGAVAADAEFARAVTERVAGIEPPYREVLELHLQSGLNAKEIAERLGRPAGTVRTQLMRALELLRRRLPAGFVAGLAPGVTSGATLGKVKAVVVARALQDAPVATAAVGTAEAVGNCVLAVKGLLIAAGLLFTIVGAAVLWQPAMPGPATMGARDAVAQTASLSQASVPTKRDAVDRALDRRAAPELAAPVAPVKVAPASLRLELHWRNTRDAATPVGVAITASDAARSQRLDAVSDSDGVCTFAALDPGRWSISSSHATRETLVDLHAGRSMTLDLDVDRSGDVTGTVLDLHGSRMADADIWIAGGDGVRHVVARSGVDGAFTVTMMDHSEIGARKNGHAPSLSQQVDARKAARDGLTLTLRGVGASLRGTVRDDRGQAVAFARVLVQPAWARPMTPSGDAVLHMMLGGAAWPTSKDDSELTQSDACGGFTLTSLLPGPTWVMVSARDLAPSNQLLDLATGTATSLDVVLQEGATLTGKVTDERGQPVPRVNIRAPELSDFAEGWFNDDDGRFVIPHLPAGDFTFQVGGPGGTSARLALASGKTTEWHPVQRRRVPRQHFGTVLGPDGSPLAHIGVRLRGAQVPDGFVAFTLENGHFVLPAIEVDASVLVGKQVVPLPAFGEEVVIRLSAADLVQGGVVGRVVDERGSAIEGTLVVMRGDGSGWQDTAKDGTFRFGALQPGFCAPMVTHPDYGTAVFPALDLRGEGVRDLGNLVLHRPGSLEIQLRDSLGRPMRGFVHLHAADGAEVARVQVIGSSRRGPLQPGRMLAVAENGDLHGVAEAEVTADAIATVELRLALTTRVPLSFVLPPDLMLDVTVIARGDDGKCADVAATSQHRLGCNLALPVGHFTLDCHVSDGRRTRTEITVRSLDESPVFEIALPPK